MRGLRRNKKTLYYALYEGQQEIIDINGNRTGEYAPAYSAPAQARMNIAPAGGAADWNPFGIDTPYTHIVMTFDLKCPISETSVVWIDKDINEPHNFVVARVAKSLNNIVYALQEVE